MTDPVNTAHDTLRAEILDAALHDWVPMIEIDQMVTQQRLSASDAERIDLVTTVVRELLEESLISVGDLPSDGTQVPDWGLAADAALYGLVLCTLSDYEGAYRYGQVGVAIADRFDGTRHANRARHLYNTHIRLWKEPWIRSADALEATHERAYANGDFEYAAFSGFMRGGLHGTRDQPNRSITRQCVQLLGPRR